jgi:hypothetical protein
MDQATMQVIAQMLGGSQSGGAQAPSSIADLLSSEDLSPRARLIASMLFASQEQASGETEDDADPHAVEVTAPVRDVQVVVDGRSQHRAARIRASLNALREELEALRDLNDSLALALGACSVCWGGDSDCTACGGRGGPGWARPEPSLYRSMVEPAVRAMSAGRQVIEHLPASTGRGDVEPAMSNGGSDA